jgi:hypothetical protein
MDRDEIYSVYHRKPILEGLLQPFHPRYDITKRFHNHSCMNSHIVSNCA